MEENNNDSVKNNFIDESYDIFLKAMANMHNKLDEITMKSEFSVKYLVKCDNNNFLTDYFDLYKQLSNKLSKYNIYLIKIDILLYILLMLNTIEFTYDFYTNPNYKNFNIIIKILTTYSYNKIILSKTEIYAIFFHMLYNDKLLITDVNAIDMQLKEYKNKLTILNE